MSTNTGNGVGRRQGALIGLAAAMIVSQEAAGAAFEQRAIEAIMPAGDALAQLVATDGNDLADGRFEPQPPTPATLPIVLAQSDGASPSEGDVAAAPAPSVPAQSRHDPLVWYALGLGAAALFLLLLGIVYLRSRRAPAQASIYDQVPPVAPEQPPITVATPSRMAAFVEVQDGTRSKLPIIRTPFTIGRRTDRDLSLWDPSVSRRHAEIERTPDGSFAVKDLDSLNGVYLNNEKINRAVLTDTDIIELGDVAIRFSLEMQFDLSDSEGAIPYDGEFPTDQVQSFNSTAETGSARQGPETGP